MRIATEDTFVMNLKSKIFYEDENETHCFPKDLGCNLSIYHTVLLFVWRTIICPAIVCENISVNHFTGSMDDVCRRTGR